MEINKDNIVNFINFIYYKNYGEVADQDIINSWSELEPEDIPYYLDELFDSWNFDKEQVQQLVQEFIAKERREQVITPTPEPPKVVESPTMPSPQNVGGNTNYQESNATYEKVSHNKVTPTNHWKGIKGVIILLPIFLATLFLNFILKKYRQFTDLNYVYVITDNVTIRDFEGKQIGRMDMFGKNDGTSYSFIRSIDKSTYEITVDNKTYPCRKVILDAITFGDYLFNREAAFAYVNVNYVTDNKDEFQLFRTVFKDINNNKFESNQLNINYRKVIIGSLKHNQDLLNTFIINTCNNTNNTYSAILKLTNPNNPSVLTAIAKMSDGYYYQFTGNVDEEEYTEPRRIRIKVPFKNEFTNLKNESLIFGQVNNNYYLFDCNKKNSNYMAIMDAPNSVNYFKWSNDTNEFKSND